jgi:branched-chain amino acid transport system permease protein
VRALGRARRLVGNHPASVPLLIAAVAIIALPAIGINAFAAQQLEVIAVYALLTSGLNLTYGFAGELAFGQVAMFAASAYTSALIGIHWIPDVLVCLPSGVAAAVIVAVITGIPGVRLRGWSLAMVSFFLVLLIPDALQLTANATGGEAGLSGIPALTLAGQPLDATGLYVLTLSIAAVWLAFMRNLILSRHGHALNVMRESPELAAALGIRTYRLKVLAYILGGIPAGLAGFVYGYLNSFLAPEYFTFNIAILILAASILGGTRTIYGPIIGAAIVEYLPLQLGVFQNYTSVAFGVFLVAGGLGLSAGATAVGRWIAKRILPASEKKDASAPAPLESLPGKPIEVEDLVVRFGGVSALDGVTLRAQPGQVTAVIGPNGSGKTTLLNAMSGFVPIAGGHVRLGEVDVTRMPVHRTAGLGVSRTFQTPIIPEDMRVSDVVAVARYNRPYCSILSSVLRLPEFRSIRKSDLDSAKRALDLIGAGDLGGEVARDLPIGMRRLIEFARAICAAPSVILLDEPAAGLNPGETVALGDLIRRMKMLGCTIILVEHNFDLVVEVADVIHVLALGKVLASGPPASIRADPRVLEAYVGAA